MKWLSFHKEKEIPSYSTLMKYTEMVLYDDMKNDIKIISQTEVKEKEWGSKGKTGVFIYCPTYDENHHGTMRLVNYRVVSPNVKLEDYSLEFTRRIATKV